MAQMTTHPRSREASRNGFADTWGKEVSSLGASEIVRRPGVVYDHCGVAITRSEFNASHRSATHGGDPGYSWQRQRSRKPNRRRSTPRAHPNDRKRFTDSHCRGRQRGYVHCPNPALLHLYVPTLLFRRLSDDFNLPGMPGHSIRYLAGVRDEIINQVGHSIVSEMTNESAAGRMFVETASLMLAAHLLRTYGDSSSCKSFESTAHRLDHARLRRVLDHISVHLANEITVAELARVAGLSTFHFARMFALAVGISPNRYVSRLRLEQAMADAAAGKLSLAQIAFKSGFSSQASFTRAFRRATGITPGEYRSDRQ